MDTKGFVELSEFARRISNLVHYCAASTAAAAWQWHWKPRTKRNEIINNIQKIMCFSVDACLCRIRFYFFVFTWSAYSCCASVAATANSLCLLCEHMHSNVNYLLTLCAAHTSILSRFGRFIRVFIWFSGGFDRSTRHIWQQCLRARLTLSRIRVSLAERWRSGRAAVHFNCLSHKMSSKCRHTHKRSIGIVVKRHFGGSVRRAGDRASWDFRGENESIFYFLILFEVIS